MYKAAMLAVVALICLYATLPVIAGEEPAKKEVTLTGAVKTAKVEEVQKTTLTVPAAKEGDKAVVYKVVADEKGKALAAAAAKEENAKAMFTVKGTVDEKLHLTVASFEVAKPVEAMPPAAK